MNTAILINSKNNFAALVRETEAKSGIYKCSTGAYHFGINAELYPMNPINLRLTRCKRTIKRNEKHLKNPIRTAKLIKNSDYDWFLVTLATD